MEKEPILVRVIGDASPIASLLNQARLSQASQALEDYSPAVRAQIVQRLCQRYHR